jgi:hypothetical protein
MSQDAGLQPPGPTPEPPAVAAPGSHSGGVRETGDYRDQLRSRRWDAAPLRNPEVEKTDPRIAVAAIVVLCAITLVILVAGYASGFWTLPA